MKNISFSLDDATGALWDEMKADLGLSDSRLVCFFIKWAKAYEKAKEKGPRPMPSKDPIKRALSVLERAGKSGLLLRDFQRNFHGMTLEQRTALIARLVELKQADIVKRLNRVRIVGK